MLRPDFFNRLGLFVNDEFLDQAACERIVSEMHRAGREPATVRTGEDRYAVDPSVRSAKLTDVSDETRTGAERELRVLQPAIARHFDIALHDVQMPQFLAYRPGDFYAAHSDHARHESAAEFSKARRVSVIVFLNSCEDQPRDGCYCGGFLTLYGLMSDPRAKGRGFPLAGKAGSLVAFPSDTIHEVTPVTWGERFTIVSWFV